MSNQLVSRFAIARMATDSLGRLQWLDKLESAVKAGTVSEREAFAILG